jgi:VCBS repeat-containing protein
MMTNSPYTLALLTYAIKKLAITLANAVLIIIPSLLLFNPACASSQDEYFDNMITLKVGRYLKQEFYDVKSNFDGDIYIDIKDFLVLTELSEYSRLSIDARNINLFMAASLFVDGKNRHINKELKNLKSITIDDRLYLSKQSMSELLPLQAVNWLAESYTLEILPNFNLPLEYRVAAQKRKRAIEEDKNNKQNSKQTDMFRAEDRKIVDLGMLKLRYDINDFNTYFKDGDENNKGDIEVEYSSQLFYGDFNIRQNLYSTGDLEYISLRYPYLFKDKTISVGDSFITGNDILGYNNKIRGISVSDNGYTIKRSGREVTIRGEAPKSAMVEIYQNGKVADYQRVEGSEYEFIVQMRSNNDAFDIKIYDRNGVLLEERNVNVMQGRNFLNKGVWDYDFFYGQNPQGENNDWDDRKYGISFGLTNNLSYSLDYYDTRNEDNLYQYLKHRAGYRFSTLSIPLVTHIAYYDSFADLSEGYIGELESEIFSHKLSYSYERYSHLLAEEENKDSYQEVEISGDYGRSDYFFRFSNKNYQDKIENNYDIGLSYDISKAIRMDLDLGRDVTKEAERQVNHNAKIAFSYARDDLTYNVDADYNQARDPYWHFSAKLRKRLSKDDKYSYHVKVNYNKNESFSLEMGFEYKFNDFLKSDYDYHSERVDMHRMGASYERVINMKKPFMINTSRTPDNSYLEGTVFVDKNGNGKKEPGEEPLVGVGVRIGHNQVKTNSEGAFYLSDISPYRSHRLIYDYSDIMVDPTLRADSVQTVELIPASGKKIAVGLVPLSLIMGSITLPETEIKIIRKFFSYVEIVVEKDGHYYTSIKPEYDGFFVVQDLTPGKYTLKVNYLGSEKITLEKETFPVAVLSGDTGDFYEGINFVVSEIKTKEITTIFQSKNTIEESLAANGGLTYELDNSNDIVQSSIDGDILTDTLTDTFNKVSVDDTDPQRVTVITTGVNDVSTITGISTSAAIEESAIQTIGSLSIADENTSDAVFVGQISTVGIYCMFNLDSEGNWTFNLDNYNTFVQQISLGRQSSTDNFLVWSLDGTESWCDQH